MSISQNFPTTKPSLLLDFANTKSLDPRIDFARASGGVYYDGKTVAKAEENLLTYSQDFDNGVWSKASVTVTANATTAPDGTTTADLVASTGLGFIFQSAVINSTSVTASIYAKQSSSATEGNRFLVWKGAKILEVTIDYSTGAITYTVGSTGVTATDVGNGWWRITLTVTSGLAVGDTVRFYPAFEGGATSGQSAYLWGAQLEARDTVTAYTPTTTQPITNYIPVLQTAPANVARFDHDPVTGESLGLLVEEQRTNLFTYSEDFSNAIWQATVADVTVESNVAVAPDGTLTAAKLVEGTADSAKYLPRTVPATAGIHTYSVYVKAAGRNYFQLFFGFGASATYRANFDLINGTVTAVAGTNATASITDVGNGVYRCSLNNISLGSGTTYAYLTLIDVGNAGQNQAYTGDGYSGIYIWGAQLESGSFSTSYIKTEASQVTRSADSASITGANFSEWYRQDEGSFYAEANTAKPTGGVAIATAYRTSNGIELLALNGSARFGSVVNGAYTANLSLGVISANTPFKVAGAYKVDDFAGSRNGGAVATDTSGLVPIPTDSTSLFIGGYNGAPSASWALAGTIKKLAYYPKRLTNEQLQALTS